MCRQTLDGGMQQEQKFPDFFHISSNKKWMHLDNAIRKQENRDTHRTNNCQKNSHRLQMHQAYSDKSGNDY
jgi:hypothetical protein